jgi:hypothetical protein
MTAGAPATSGMEVIESSSGVGAVHCVCARSGVAQTSRAAERTSEAEMCEERITGWRRPETR